MSTETEADRMLDKAKDNVQSAIENLSTIIVDKVWGHDDFNKEYKMRIMKSFYDLVDIRERLNVNL